MPTFDVLDAENIAPSNQKFMGKLNYNFAAETKSEFQFPVNHKKQKTNMEWDQKSRGVPQSYYQRNVSRSPNTQLNDKGSKVQKSLLGQSKERYTFHE